MRPTAQSYDPLAPVVRRAVQLARDPDAPERTSGGGDSSPAPPMLITTAGIDGFTVWPALTDIDVTNNAQAVTS